MRQSWKALTSAHNTTFYALLSQWGFGPQVGVELESGRKLDFAPIAQEIGDTASIGQAKPKATTLQLSKVDFDFIRDRVSGSKF